MTMRAVTTIAVPTRGAEPHRAAGGTRPPIGVSAVVPVVKGSGVAPGTRRRSAAATLTAATRVTAIVPTNEARVPHPRGGRTRPARAVRDTGTTARRRRGAAMIVTIVRGRTAGAGTSTPGRTVEVTMTASARTGTGGWTSLTRTGAGSPTIAPGRRTGLPDRGAMIARRPLGAGMRPTGAHDPSGPIGQVGSTGMSALVRIVVDAMPGRGAPGTSVPTGSRGPSAPAAGTGRTESVAAATAGNIAAAVHRVDHAPRAVLTRSGAATAATR